MSASLEFEWDTKKAANNLQKHGISFEEAAFLMQNSHYVIEPSLRAGEMRYKATGLLEEAALSVVFVPRNGKIRIISARGASREEREKYGKSESR